MKDRSTQSKTPLEKWTMTRYELDAIFELRSHLTQITRLVENWLENQPERTFVDFRTMARKFDGEATLDELVEFFDVLEKSSLGTPACRIMDDQGLFIEGSYASPLDIPPIAVSNSGQLFEVRASNIVQVYELKRPDRPSE